MIDRVQLVAIIVSISLLLFVLELVRRRRLVEEYSILWIAGSLGLLVLSMWRELLDAAAGYVGVYYPPSFMLMVLVVLVFVALLGVSVVLSGHRRQLEWLTEEVAVLGAEIREVRLGMRGDVAARNSDMPSTGYVLDTDAPSSRLAAPSRPPT